MKIMKKSLCVILSLLFVMTGLSAGVVAFAADTATSAEYTSLALAFFSYSRSTSGATTTYTINTDSNGFPSLTIVGDMDQYEVSNESGDYEYADDSGSAIRAISYTHTVTAKDNSNSQIWNAASIYLGIASTLMSYEYGTGYYTVPMVTDAVADTLKTVKLNGEYLFLDGYTYIIDAYGDFVGRSVDKTYTVKDGEASYYSDSSDDVIFYDEYGNTGTLSELFSNTRTTSSGREIDLSTINEVTLFEACNVKTVLQYFSGNMTTVNSGNWFHDFVFNVYTDMETILTTETLQNKNVTVYNRTITWTMNRSYDESGTKARYYNNGYVQEDAAVTYDNTMVQLTNLQGVMDGYFSTYYADGKLAATTNADLLNGYYADIMQYYDVFESISNEAKIAVFGDDAYSYMNLVTQLTPIIGKTSLDEYTPSHTYEKYVDSSGNNVTYEVTTEKVTTIVTTLDNLLESEKVGDIIKLFIDFSDEQYAGSAVYGVEANTAQEVLVQIIQYYLYSDDILNLVIKYIYSTVCNLLDQYITDDFINGALKSVFSGLDTIVSWVAYTGDGWQALIYGMFSKIGIGLTPAGVAYVWNYYGYLTSGTDEENAVITANHDILKAAEGGTNSVASGGYTTGDYNALGVEGDDFCGDRWQNVDYDKLVWNINGDEDKFKTYLCTALVPLAPLLGVLLGGQQSKLLVGQFLFELYLILDDIHLYDDVLVPLFETLGITSEYGLLSVSEFENYAAIINTDSGRTKANVETFLNKGLIEPLLNWVKNSVLVDPITVIAELLPNLSYYLTSGQLVESIKQLDIPIGAQFGVTINPVYTLAVGDLLGDALDFLYSIQGILDLIGLSVDTGIAIVGYYDPSGSGRVYRPDDSHYDADTMTEEATGAYLSANGEMSIYKDSEFTTYITAYNDDGSYSDYAIFNVVGYANSSGYVVTARTEDQVSEYTTEVYYYYEWTVYDEEAMEDITYRRTTAPTDGSEYTLVQSTVNATSTAELPAIMDYKLQACGTLTTTTSARTSDWSLTNENGGTETWTAYTRKYIKLEALGEETSGLVLLYVFRYLFCALEYRAYSETEGGFIGDYSILDAISGLRDILESELFSGFYLQDIIDNIALEPDEAIAAFYELFYPNETGSMYTVNDSGNVVSGSDYVYDMDYVNYYHDEIIAAVKETGDTTYGSSVLYTEYWTKENSQYVIDNLDDMIEDVLSMLKLDVLGSSFDSIGGFLEDLLDQYLFNNEMLSTIAGALYGLLDSIDSFDLSALLGAVFDIDYSKKALSDALDYEFGTTVEVSTMLTVQRNQGNTAYDDTTFYNVQTTVDEGTGEDIVTYTSYDWGFNNTAVTNKYSNSEIFLRGLSAILSPFVILVEYLLCGENLSLLDVITIPGYDTYYYAWIPFMEALGADQDLLSYDKYYEKVFAGESETAQNCDAFYYLLKPIMSFVDNIIASPVEFLFDIIPNVMFVLSIGGLNDILNNLLHFAYVLVDMIQPIYDVYPLLNSLLSNIRIGDIVLNIAIPLDFDFNQLVNDLIEGLLGDLLSFDIENTNIVLGTYEAEEEVFVPTLDAEGNEQIDEDGAVIGEYVTQTVTKEQYAVGTLKIALPYIDLTTFCAGTVTEMFSKSYNTIIYLDSSGGADLLTLLLRLVVDTLFYEDNAMNVADFLIGYCQLDDEYDNDDLLIEIFTYLNSEALNNDYPDKTLKLLYTVYYVLSQITGNLGYRFQNVDFSIIDMFSDMSNITSYITALMNAGESSNSTLSGFALLIEKLRAFFQAIVDFFRSLFGMS